MSEVLIWSGRETEGLVLVFMSFCSTLILSGGWWHGISSFFLILFVEKRRRGEFKIGLIVLADSKPKGHFIMQLSCLLCLPSGWVGPCVPGVIE